MVRARLAELKRQATSVTLEDFLTECRHTEITKVSPESEVPGNGRVIIAKLSLYFAVPCAALLFSLLFNFF